MAAAGRADTLPGVRAGVHREQVPGLGDDPVPKVPPGEQARVLEDDPC